MQSIRVTVPGREHTYDIHIGSGLLAQAESLFNTALYSKVFVVTDEHTEQLWLSKLRQAIPKIDGAVVLPPGEQAKHIDSVQRIWLAMREARCDRKSLVVILGGGVIGDMGAFAASTYMRGVVFVQIATTLLAQVDSSAGGKTGIDFDGIKNLIGTFAQPAVVLIDTDTLGTLPKRELAAGFAEMFKYGLIKDAGYFERLAQKPPADFNAEELAGLIDTPVRIKAGIVERDAKESGERKLVNFGHTIGHAVEALSWSSDHPLLHGEATAIGMAVEADLSQQTGFISADDVQRIRQVLMNAGLPTKVPELPAEALLEKMRADKKNEHGALLFTLLQHIGQAVYNQQVDENVVVQAIERNREAS